MSPFQGTHFVNRVSFVALVFMLFWYVNGAKLEFLFLKLIG